MSLRTTLFAYGRLRPGYSPPRSVHDVEEDYARGYMFLRTDHKAKDPALVSPGDSEAPWVRGDRMSVFLDELMSIDKEETGYERRIVRLRSGKAAWVYVWKGDVPAGVKYLTHWDMKGKDTQHP